MPPFEGNEYTFGWTKQNICPPPQKKMLNIIFPQQLGWLVGSGEPCFQGRPIQYFTNPYAFILSHCRVMSQDPRGIRSWSSHAACQFLEARTLPTKLINMERFCRGPRSSDLFSISGEEEAGHVLRMRIRLQVKKNVFTCCEVVRS